MPQAWLEEHSFDHTGLLAPHCALNLTQNTLHLPVSLDDEDDKNDPLKGPLFIFAGFDPVGLSAFEIPGKTLFVQPVNDERILAPFFGAVFQKGSAAIKHLSSSSLQVSSFTLKGLHSLKKGQTLEIRSLNPEEGFLTGLKICTPNEPQKECLIPHLNIHFQENRFSMFYYAPAQGAEIVLTYRPDGANAL